MFWNRQVFGSYRLNLHRSPTLGLYLKFCLNNILFYSEFSLDRIHSIISLENSLIPTIVLLLYFCHLCYTNLLGDITSQDRLHCIFLSSMLHKSPLRYHLLGQITLYIFVIYVTQISFEISPLRTDYTVYFCHLCYTNLLWDITSQDRFHCVFLLQM